VIFRLAGAALTPQKYEKIMALRAVKCLLLLLVATCSAQNVAPNAQPRIAPALQECYRNRTLFERDNRLPMTPNMLIELLRKVEDSPGFSMSLQLFTTSLLHRFKQDGIIRESIESRLRC
jgi:hypothetical protein